MTEWNALTREEKGALIKPLIELHGLTYSAIARQIGVSRVAIAGAAHRNGLVSPYNPGANGKHNGQRRLKTSEPKSRIAPTQPIAPPDAFVDRTPIKPRAWEPLPGTVPKRLHEMEVGECCWPVVENPTVFCSAPVEQDRVYCSTHAAIAFRPKVPK